MNIPVAGTCPDGLFSPADACRAGYDDAALRRQVRSGAWVRLRQGLLVERTVLEDCRADPIRELALRVAVARRALGRQCVAALESSAHLHGLPTLAPAPETTIHLVAPPSSGLRTAAVDLEIGGGLTPVQARRDVAALRAVDVRVAAGQPATTAARTVVDLARRRPFDAGVVTADAALRANAAGREHLREMLAFCRHWPGVARAAEVVEFADGRAESVLESVSRVRIHEASLPTPDLNVWLGRDWPTDRADFVWTAQRVIGEADGKVKYDPDSSELRTLWAEKRREDRLRDLGFEVVRWTWAELDRPEMFRAKIVRAFERAAHRFRLPTTWSA